MSYLYGLDNPTPPRPRKSIVVMTAGPVGIAAGSRHGWGYNCQECRGADAVNSFSELTRVVQIHKKRCGIKRVVRI